MYTVPPAVVTPAMISTAGAQVLKIEREEGGRGGERKREGDGEREKKKKHQERDIEGEGGRDRKKDVEREGGRESETERMIGNTQPPKGRFLTHGCAGQLQIPPFSPNPTPQPPHTKPTPHTPTP